MNDLAKTPDGEPVESIRKLLTESPEQTLGLLFERHADRLLRMIQLRMDPKLATRVDCEDVLQEAYVQALSRVEHFVSSSIQSPFVWLRLMAFQTLTDVHRRHLGAQARDANREHSINMHRSLADSNRSLVATIAGSFTSPSGAMRDAEINSQVGDALTSMEHQDRELLMMRHFEDLTNGEVAEALGLTPSAASMRYSRALVKLQNLLVQQESPSVDSTASKTSKKD